MRKSFRFVHLENELQVRSGPPPHPPIREVRTTATGSLRYNALFDVEYDKPTATPFLTTNQSMADLLKLWDSVSSSRTLMGAGYIHLQNFYSFGDASLLADYETGLCYVGSIITWGIEHAQWYLRKVLPKEYGLIQSADGQEFSIEIPEAVPDIPEGRILMTSSGQDIFGHWLLDFTPRFLLAETMPKEHGMQYILPKISDWMRPFLRTFHITEQQISRLPEAPLQRGRSSVTPSGAKSGFRIGGPVNRMAWHRLRQSLLSEPLRADEQLPPSAEKIYVSRRHWGSARPIQNLQRLEEIAVSRGFTVVYPERYSLPAQARMFNAARVVVGEDGSGLHNIIFANPGAALLVIATPDRPNLWHAGFCEQMGHVIGYVVSTPPEAGGRRINEREFVEVLDKMEAVITT